MSSVRRWEGSELHPIQDENLFHFFDPAEVATLAIRRGSGAATTSGGDLAAAAFELFSRGAGQREAVVALRQPPSVVRQLYTDWGRAGDVWIDRTLLIEVAECFQSILQTDHRPRPGRASDLVDLASKAAEMTQSLRTNNARRADRVHALREELANADAEIARLEGLLGHSTDRNGSEKGTPS